MNKAIKLSILTNFLFRGDMETASTASDKGEHANCIPCFGFRFGPTVYDGFKNSCAMHTTIELSVLTKFELVGCVCWIEYKEHSDLDEDFALSTKDVCNSLLC